MSELFGVTGKTPMAGTRKTIAMFGSAAALTEKVVDRGPGFRGGPEGVIRTFLLVPELVSPRVRELFRAGVTGYRDGD